MTQTPASGSDLPTNSIQVFFAGLPDPRLERTKLHELGDILTIAICASICGAEHWTHIQDFGEAKIDWLGTFLKLPHGIPSHDTFGRVFALLDAKAFEKCLAAWTAHLAQDLAGEIVAFDGKSLRRSFKSAQAKSPWHLVSAWAAESGLVLAQVATEEGSDKSNEIKAIPRLLEILDLKGATVTIDAIGCQTAIARQIVEKKADYVLAVKDNQPKLLEDVQRVMKEAMAPVNQKHRDYHETVEKAHGRLEVRRTWVTDRVAWMDRAQRWAGLSGLGLIERERTVNGQTSIERSYYITSIPRVKAKRLAYVVRAHWGIENRLHWSLDVSFNEDQCRLRVGQAARNLAVVRKIALNQLRLEKTLKLGVKGKRLRAGWDPAYLLKVLAAKPL